MKPAPSVYAARAVVQALAAAGVREVVLSPGSRSAPLAYALADAAREDRPAGAPAVVVHVRLDERDAAFLALGIAKAAAAAGQPRPVAVVTTSGTAVGNLVPAVLEAHHSGTPLLLLTADRPPSLRGTGANQTTGQPGLLEPAVRLTLDLVVGHDELEDMAAGMREAVTLAARTALSDLDPGPVHVNLAFDDPLVPGDEPWPADPSAAEDAPASGPIHFGFVGGARVPGPPEAESGQVSAEPGGAPELPDGPPTVVVAGDGAGARARELAEARGWPLLAEPTSGARGGPHVVSAYRLLLDAWPGALEVRRVVVIGRPTLSRPVARLLARDDVEVIRVQRPSAAWPDAGRSADVLLAELPDAWLRASSHGSEWLDRWVSAGETALRIVREECAVADGEGRAVPRMTGVALADLVARASAPGDVLVVGSSNPVRDLDLVAQWSSAPLVIANRGLSGIDGMTASAAGVALTLPDRVVRAVVGDLTFLHDVGGLLTGTL
ncbi:MAG: 2-succinyl-5-enolpyruvyl-6-hydroxy-3-cyclohexene-1-carboxylic-acid synthase, partial [Actinomycetales bacterium]|nr:2-succinyl-5-enolpyruvyl-6-hydroxy-3-cyclohexene-1-carboxylic-acid synthase [Actinomycetales bacterium]